jgi:hypothetical protein
LLISSVKLVINTIGNDPLTVNIYARQLYFPMMARAIICSKYCRKVEKCFVRHRFCHYLAKFFMLMRI